MSNSGGHSSLFYSWRSLLKCAVSRFSREVSFRYLPTLQSLEPNKNFALVTSYRAMVLWSWPYVLKSEVCNFSKKLKIKILVLKKCWIYTDFYDLIYFLSKVDCEKI